MYKLIVILLLMGCDNNQPEPIEIEPILIEEVIEETFWVRDQGANYATT